MQTDAAIPALSMKYLKRCHDDCEMFVATYRDDSIHHAQLRCRQHGWIKWLSRSQAEEIRAVINALTKDK